MPYDAPLPPTTKPAPARPESVYGMTGFMRVGAIAIVVFAALLLLLTQGML